MSNYGTCDFCGAKQVREKVLEYMRRFGGINKFEALEDIGCKYLASVISDLRQQGIAIGRRTKYGKNRYGDTVRFSEYYLIE